MPQCVETDVPNGEIQCGSLLPAQNYQVRAWRGRRERKRGSWYGTVRGWYYDKRSVLMAWMEREIERKKVPLHRNEHSILMKILVGNFCAKPRLIKFIHCKY